MILNLPDSYRDGIARAIRGTLLLPVIAMQQTTVDRTGRFADPMRLRAERDSLAVYLVGQSNLAAENRQLRSLLGVRQRLPYSFVPAEIIRLTGVDQRGAFQLTAGQNDGVTPGSPIIAAGGLVGAVRDADAEVATGIDWTHTDFRASAMTTDASTYGIVEPRTMRSGEQVLALTGTPAHTELTPGTMIVTSGQGGVYPRGIPIGRVIEVEKEEQEADWRRSYLVRPLVGPAAMDYVLVLGPLTPGRTEADLAAAWGIRADELKAPPPDTSGMALRVPSLAAPAVPRSAPAPARTLPDRAPAAIGTPVVTTPTAPVVRTPAVQAPVRTPPAQNQAQETQAPRPAATPPAQRPQQRRPVPLLGTPVQAPPDTTP